jgi:hypothetical protein
MVAAGTIPNAAVRTHWALGNEIRRMFQRDFLMPHCHGIVKHLHSDRQRADSQVH